MFNRYRLLVKEHQYQKDQRSFGALFFHLCDKLADISFQKSMQLLMDALMQVIQDKLCLTKKQLNELLDAFISTLPTSLKQAMNIPI